MIIDRLKAIFLSKRMTVNDVSHSPVTYRIFKSRFFSKGENSKEVLWTGYEWNGKNYYWAYPLDIKEDIFELWNDMQIYLDSPKNESRDEVLAKLSMYTKWLNELTAS